VKNQNLVRREGTDDEVYLNGSLADFLGRILGKDGVANWLMEERQATINYINHSVIQIPN